MINSKSSKNHYAKDLASTRSLFAVKDRMSLK